MNFLFEPGRFAAKFLSTIATPKWGTQKGEK
jgi:hypothetical protein